MDDAPQRSKPPCYREDALAVVRALRDAGHVAYFAGGCVRDLLLGLEPVDFDVATDAVPDKVRSIFRNTQAVGQAFGVILVRLGRSVVEVATFRSDGKYLDGRRPSEVQFTTAEQDARRRDFTINGLFLDPVADRVIDYVGGQEDLNSKLLRAIGEAEARFEEDHLRLLRAVRFAARFGLTIEPKTRVAIVHHARKLVQISPERVGEEVRLMFPPPTRAAAWKMLCQMGLAAVIYRFLPDAQGPASAPSLLAGLTAGKPIPLGLALAAATLDMIGWLGMDDAGKRGCFARPTVQRFVRALRQSLKISNEESGDMAGTLEGLAPLMGAVPPSLAIKKRFLARPTAQASRELLDAVAAADVWPQRITALREEFMSLEQTDYAPPPLVSGDNLTAAGLQPGPVFKRVLEAVYDAQLEDRVHSKPEALALALRLAQTK